MPSDSAHAKFLYTIIKQLDLKSIDWQTVANALEITNGHAARMRYSRFKAQMEGYPATGRRRAGVAATANLPTPSQTPPATPAARAPSQAPKKAKKSTINAVKPEKAAPKHEERSTLIKTEKEKGGGSVQRVKKRSLEDHLDTDMADDESTTILPRPLKRSTPRVKVEPEEDPYGVLPSIETPAGGQMREMGTSMENELSNAAIISDPVSNPTHCLPAPTNTSIHEDCKTFAEGQIRIKVQPMSHSPPPVAVPSPLRKSSENKEADGPQIHLATSRQQQQQQQQQQEPSQTQMIMLPSREGFGPFGGIFPPPQQVAMPTISPQLIDPQLLNTMTPTEGEPKGIIVKLEPNWENPGNCVA